MIGNTEYEREILKDIVRKTTKKKEEQTEDNIDLTTTESKGKMKELIEALQYLG